MRTPEDITNEIIAIYEKVEDLKRKAMIEQHTNPADKTVYLALKSEWSVLENSVIDLVHERREAFRQEALQEKADAIKHVDEEMLETHAEEQMEPMTHDEELDLQDSISEANSRAHGEWGDRDLPDRNEDGEYLNGGGYMP